LLAALWVQNFAAFARNQQPHWLIVREIQTNKDTVLDAVKLNQINVLSE